MRLLQEVATLGDFFSIATTAAVTGWEPMGALADGSGALDAQVERTRAALARPPQRSAASPGSTGGGPAGVEPPVAASIMHQGLAARIASPALACAATGGWVPRMQLSRMWWRPADPGPVPMTLPDPHGKEGDTTERLGQLLRLLVVDMAISTLVTAVERDTGLSPHIAWGNVASAFVGAAAVLGRRRAEAGPAAAAIVVEVLRHPRLRDEGEFEPTGAFRRRSCCLYYRLPNGGLCGDCVLAG